MFILVSLNVAILCITDYLQGFSVETVGVSDATELSSKVLSPDVCGELCDQNQISWLLVDTTDLRKDAKRSYF